MEHVISGGVFFLVGGAVCFLLLYSLEGNTRGFIFSDKFVDYFIGTAFFLLLALAVTKTVPTLLFAELEKFSNDQISTLYLMGFLLGLFGGLAVLTLLLTYIEILVVAGARKLSNWINTI